MATLFDYKNLSVSLDKETRSLIVTLAKNKSDNSLTIDTLIEIESILNWAATHIEINTILFRSSSDYFSTGANQTQIMAMSVEQLSHFFNRIQKLVSAMFFLPQTIIFDLKKGATGIAAELALGADIRIAETGASIHFDHLQKGHIPMCGGISFLTTLFGNAHARNFLLCSRPIATEVLLQSGYLHETYNFEEEVLQLLVAISHQAPVQRIQTKRALLETIIKQLDATQKFEKEFGLAGLLVEDYKNKEFSLARDIAHKAKEEMRLRAEAVN